MPDLRKKINETRRRNLLRLMEERGIQQAELARLYGCKPNYISMLAKPGGHANIGTKTVKRLCEIFEVDEAEFHRDVADPDESTPAGQYAVSDRALLRYPWIAPLVVAANSGDDAMVGVILREAIRKLNTGK